MDTWLNNRLLPMATSVYFEDLLASSNNPPPSSDYIIAENGSFITTQTSNFLITQG